MLFAFQNPRDAFPLSGPAEKYVSSPLSSTTLKYVAVAVAEGEANVACA
jgi:hypothetical protein